MSDYCLSYGWLVWLSVRAGSLPTVSRLFEASLRPMLAHQPGFIEAQFLVDPGQDRCLVVSLWVSADCCQDAQSSHGCQTVFQQLGEYFAAQPTVACCEVVGQIN